MRRGIRLTRSSGAAALCLAPLCLAGLLALSAILPARALAVTVKNSTPYPVAGSVHLERDDTTVVQFRLAPGEKRRMPRKTHGSGFVIRAVLDRKGKARHYKGEAGMETLDCFVEIFMGKGKLDIVVEGATFDEEPEPVRVETRTFPCPRSRPPGSRTEAQWPPPPGTNSSSGRSLARGRWSWGWLPGESRGWINNRVFMKSGNRTAYHVDLREQGGHLIFPRRSCDKIGYMYNWLHGLPEYFRDKGWWSALIDAEETPSPGPGG